MIEILKANIVNTRELQVICRQSYTEVFASHWTKNGLEIYLEEQFNVGRLKSELTDSDYDYFFIRKDKEKIGFAKVKYKT